LANFRREFQSDEISIYLYPNSAIKGFAFAFSWGHLFLIYLTIQTSTLGCWLCLWHKFEWFFWPTNRATAKQTDE